MGKVSIPRSRETRHHTLAVKDSSISTEIVGGGKKERSQCNQFTMPLSMQANWEDVWKLTLKKTCRCNQWEFTSVHAGNLIGHFNTHSREKSNKCNQCDYLLVYANYLRQQLRNHSGEKSYKCFNLWEAALRTHLKTHSGKNYSNTTNVTLHLSGRAI